MENNNNGNYGQGSHGSQQGKHDNYSNQDQNESRSASSMSSDMDSGTGSNQRQQGMGSRGNYLNDAAMSRNPQNDGSDSNRMNGRNDDANRAQWDNTGGDTYSSRQENAGGNMGDESGEDNMRLSSDDMENEWNSTSGINSQPDHNMSSGSAYLEEDVDRASRDTSGGHDYMENNGNSSVDYNLNRRLDTTNDFEAGSHSQDMRSDNDDFNDSGFDDDDGQAWRDKIRSDDSRTFNEDEPTWKEEKRMSGPEEGSGGDYGSRNAGTANNNWDATDQMQRGNGLHDDEEDRNSAF